MKTIVFKFFISFLMVIITNSVWAGNTITYTSSDGIIIDPSFEDVSIVSNVYENGKGVITFDGEVTNIGNYAFSGCNSLTSIELPSSLTSIGNYAFSDCNSLTSIELPSSLTSIGNYAFSDCNSLTSIELPSSLTSIDNHAFSGCCSLTSISLPNSLTYIGESAFSHCNSLTAITIPASVTTIDSDAFYGCYFTEQSFVNNSSIPTPEYHWGATIVDQITDDGVSIVNNEVVNCVRTATKVTLPNSVTSIGWYAFSGCNSLTSITLPNSLTYIGESAFSGCNSLTSIELPSSLTGIDSYTFEGTSMTTIVFPSSLEYLDIFIFGHFGEIPRHVYCLSEEPPITEFFSNGMQNGRDDYGYGPFGLYKILKLIDFLHWSHDWEYVDINSTLYVKENSLEAYKNAEMWNCFKSIQVLPEDFEYKEKYAIIDGAEHYENAKDMACDNLTYTRTFNNTKWQALYVPFAMNYDDWKEDFEVACINNMNQYDTDGDNKPDVTVMEIFKMEEDECVEPNTPYLIRAREEGMKTISLINTTLFQTEEKTYDVTSWKMKYEFTGTYRQIAGSTMLNNGYYAIGNGSLHQASSADDSLGAFRWYMKVSDRNSNPQQLGAVRIVEYGEEISDLSIATLLSNDPVINETYSLDGCSLDSSAKGLQIKQGKVVFVR